MKTTQTIDLNRFKDAVGFTASFKCWGNSRKASLDAVTTEADKRRLRLTKRLIECKEYDDIKKFFGELRGWLYRQTVPSFFKDGFQLASLEAVDRIEKRMKQAVDDDLPPLVLALSLVYDDKVKEAKEALKDQFRAADYPSSDVLAELFGIDWYWIAFTTPEALPPELRKAEEEKFQSKMRDAGEQITLALREAFQELIAHAVDRLTPDAEGNKKRFNDSVIGNIREFIETFSSRNLMGDAELESMVEKAKTVLAGAGGANGDPDKLRKFTDIRDGVKGQFDDIKKQLDTMIETRKARAFDLSGEEDDGGATE